MYSEPNKFYAYQGLVISSVVDNDTEQSDLVLLLQDEKGRTEKQRVYGVAKTAFTPPTKEDDFLKADIAKNRERRYAVPLKFGDIIQWNDEDCDHLNHAITSFKREKPLYQVSSCAAGHLLKLGGVIQPNKPTVFWTPFQSVTIPAKEALKAEPDVWLFAWIKFETLMLKSSDPVQYMLTFNKFEECDYSQQGRVGEAPWHRSSLDSKFAVWAAEPAPLDSDDEIACEPPAGVIEKENKWAEIIHKQLGLYVGGRLIICKDLPQYDFIIPLLTPMTLATDEKTAIYPSVGEYFHFSAIWSNNHRSFLVRDMMPYLTLRSHMVTPNGNMCVRVNYAVHNGLFIDDDESLGLIDDPTQSLAFFEFYPYVHLKLRATVEIRAVRATENRTIRYRVIRPIFNEDLMHKYQEWISVSEFSIGLINGVLINNDTVVCAKHPNIYFRFHLKPDERRPPYGTIIRFRARRQLDVFKEMLITEWQMAPETPLLVVEEDGLIFFKVRLRVIPGHEQLAMSSHFGIVDIRQHNPPKNAGEEYSAWVRESPFKGDSRRAATIFEVYSTSANPSFVCEADTTDSELPSSAGSSVRGSHCGSYYGSSARNSRNSKNFSGSISSSRFVGPRSCDKWNDGYTSSSSTK